MTAVNTETEADTEAEVSCVVSGLTKALDAVTWTDGAGSQLTSDDTNYVISSDSFSGSSQTTTLTVVAGVSTDTQYSCVVTSDEWLVTNQITSVSLSIFGN